MTQAADEHHEALTRRAQERLGAGASADAVFVELAGDGAPVLRAVAIAVCVAAGTPLAEAEERWAADGEEAVAAAESDVEDLGWILEKCGFFDFHRPLDEHEQQISLLLRQAFAAHGGWASGHGWTLTRRLQTGQLAKALASMSASAPRRATEWAKPSPSNYWTRLLEAAELLSDGNDANDGDDDQMAEIAILCRRRLDELSAADPDAST